MISRIGPLLRKCSVSAISVLSPRRTPISPNCALATAMDWRRSMDTQQRLTCSFRRLACLSSLRTLAVVVLAMTMAPMAVAGPDEHPGVEYLHRPLACSICSWLQLLQRRRRGAAEDYAEALKWFRLAADQGHADAQFYLGVTNARGKGVPRNDVQAHMWFNLAASQQSGSKREIAIKARELAASQMTPKEISEAQKLARERVTK